VSRFHQASSLVKSLPYFLDWKILSNRKWNECQTAQGENEVPKQKIDIT
jgi:hypothetical protein